MPPKRYTPAPFCPTISATGSEEQVTLSGENMWLRTSRFGTTYAEQYAGNLDLGESVATKTLTGTFTTTAGSTTVTGAATAFISELHLGSFVFLPRGAQGPNLLVVEKIVSDTSFIASRAADYSSGGAAGYVLPVLFPVGSDRGTLVRGNAVQFPRGHYLAVGDGTLRINGTALNATLAASRTPRFALYDPVTNTYTQDDVGIAKPLSPITIAAVAAAGTAIASSTDATPIVVTTAADHHLFNGQKINIASHATNVAANGDRYVKNLTATTFSLYSDEKLTTPVAGSGAGAGGATGTISGKFSLMRAGGYNIRVMAKSTKTLGYSQPTDAIAPVTLTDGQEIQITFNSAMVTDQDAYDIYGSRYEDNTSTGTIQGRYMGPWYLIKTVTDFNLRNNSFATGRETGSIHFFSYADAEVASATNLISFNNFTPVEAEFVDLINGIPLYFSCLGKGTTTKASSSPGPACVPSKPSNPEGVFLNKAITTAGGDTIIGEFNAKSRIYALCQNSLQTLILTTLDEEPITFRSLWNSGFRNPYNVAFVKEYLYGFSTQKIVRSVAGGDDSTVEFEFASDVRDLVNSWATGHVLVGYDPKNRAVCFFYAAAELRTGYYVTKVLPFLLDRQIWNPPIILKKANQDFVVSGVATIDDKLVFLAGGETSTPGTVAVGTYVFDGGDSETKDWYLAWNFSDDGEELHPKKIAGFTAMGRFNSASTALMLYGIQAEGSLDYSLLAAGTNASKSFTIGALGTSATTARKRLRKLDWGPLSTYTIRISGSAANSDRLDEIVLDVNVNSSET